MKVLHVTNAYPTAGHPVFGVFIKEQIESIDKSGTKTDTYFINARENGKMEYLRCVFKLRPLLKEYDVIHCHHVFCALVVLAARSARNRIVVSFLSTGPDEFNFRYRIPFSSFLYAQVLKKSSARIFKFGLPEALANDPMSFYIPNGVNTQLFRPVEREEAKRALGLEADRRYLLFVSSNHLERPEKRYDKFLQTLSLLKSEYGLNDIEPLVIVKETRERVPLYFCAAHIHVLCSDVEGSPNSVKESLACNTPVVATNVGNVMDLRSGLKGCHISMNKTPEELARYCHELLVSDQSFAIRPRIAELGLDIDSVAKKIVAVYKAVLG